MEKLPCDWSADNRMLCLGKPERLTFGREEFYLVKSKEIGEQPVIGQAEKPLEPHPLVQMSRSPQILPGPGQSMQGMLLFPWWRRSEMVGSPPMLVVVLGWRHF